MKVLKSVGTKKDTDKQNEVGGKVEKIGTRESRHVQAHKEEKDLSQGRKGYTSCWFDPVFVS